MPDSAAVQDGPPSGKSYVVVATLIVWTVVMTFVLGVAALIFVGSGLLGRLVIATLVVGAFVAVPLIGRHRGGTATVVAAVIVVSASIALLAWLWGEISEFDPGPPLDRGGWESEVGGQVEDPALVRRLRDAAGANGAVAVEVSVFDAGVAGQAPAVRIQADDVLTYLGRRHSSITEALERSNRRAWFLEVYDEDGDEAYQSARYARNGVYTGWARRDIYECFFTTSLVHGPPCPIDFSD